MRKFEDYSRLIEKVIVEHEGGWKLTDRKDDSGGLTYGGMTYYTFDKWQRKHQNTMFVREAFKRAARKDSEVLRDAIRLAYYDVFIKRSNIEHVPSFLKTPYISTAINMGRRNAVRVLQRATNEMVRRRSKYGWAHQQELVVDGLFGPKTREAITTTNNAISVPGMFEALRAEYLVAFTDACMEFYIRIVQNNARHWRSSQRRGTTPPSVLQSENLMGWFNRTKMYRE